ncbi:MAG: homoserine dehydrogenase [Clostridia bacterium]|nr:homoserine dehydrogenase [Clostridia bacterium]
MINVAVLGFGTVGSGVVEIINNKDFSKKTGKDINVKKVLDIRTFEDSPYKDLITADFDSIINDEEISIVVETMGGTNPAYDFTKRSLLAGKSVVTSNKELVATHGTELLSIAKEKGVCYMFEASVGGGIPIIRPLGNCLAANDINWIMGILNGTTNYILTKMINDGESFENALADAQAKGYAERNPAADVEGTDACRKIAILASLAFGKFVDSHKISTEGITNISLEDVKNAQSIGHSIKLIGQCKKVGDEVFAKVSPVMLPPSNALSDVEGVFNGILVNGSATGDVMFYGKGAGKMPTASAVVADVIDIVGHKGLGAPYWEDGGILTDVNPDDTKLYVRVLGDDVKSAVADIFGDVEVLKDCGGEYAFISAPAKECELNKKAEELKAKLGADAVKNTIQVIF